MNEKEPIGKRVSCAMGRFHKYKFSKYLTNLSEGEYLLLNGVRYVEKTKKSKKENPDVKVSDLGKFFKISPPAVSRMSHALEKKKFVTLENSPKDKRNIFIKITKEGEKELEHSYEMMNRFMTKVGEKMGMENLEILLVQLEKLDAIFQEEVETKEIYRAIMEENEKERKRK